MWKEYFVVIAMKLKTGKKLYLKCTDSDKRMDR